jgi:hypothetical protein
LSTFFEKYQMFLTFVKLRWSKVRSLTPPSRRLRRGVLPRLFVEIAWPQLGDADPVGLVRLPNQLAANPDSRIIVAWLSVTDEIWHVFFASAVLGYR